MKKNYIILTAFLLTQVFTINAQVNYTVPEGGWTYIYNGEEAEAADTAALDGTWNHDNGSDEWDGTTIGDGNMGGVSVNEEDETTYLTIQDTGDPRDAQGATDPSNRKIYFYHLFSQDGIASDKLMDDGITLAFRARISSYGVEDLNPDGAGAGATEPYPSSGDGFEVSFYGKGMITLYQRGGSEPEEQIGFSIITGFDNEIVATTGEGLVMNTLAGNVAIQGGDVDFPSTATGIFTYNIINLDPLEWHEFWIQIKEDVDAVGTHDVKVWMDGEADPISFKITAGSSAQSETDNAYIAFGSASTGASGAMDMDYLAYKEGLIDPVLISGIDHTMADNFNVSIHPNPFYDNIRITADEKIKFISVINLLGIELTKVKVMDKEVILNLESLKDGLYILQVQGDKGYENYRIAKK